VARFSARKAKRLPPLWLGAAAVASGWAALFSVKRWIDHYVQEPALDDFRVYYYTAKVGLQQGWDHIYNQSVLRAVMAAHFTGPEAVVDGGHTYPNLPALAWMIAPLTVLAFGPAYLAWSLVGLACVVIAWWLVCPYRGVTRVTLLLLAVAIWPIHYSVIFGQPTPEILALVAAAWWFLRHDRPAAAGVALAIATGLKPQDLVLVPFALLVSGRIQVFAWWAGACVALGAMFFAFLGVGGVRDFWQTTVMVESFSGHKILTVASFVGPGLPAAVAQALLGVLTLAAAWRRRASLELVIAIGLVGSVVTALHAHESDFSMLVLAAWLVLRSPIGSAARLWLLPGIAAVQAMAVGWALPVLLWDLVWLGLLAGGRMTAQRTAPEPHAAVPELSRPASPG
jgi:hypothetical protein